MSDPAAPSSVPPEQPGASAATPEPPVISVETTGLPSNLAACLACIFSLVGGIVFLVLEKKDKFVRFHAMQAVVLGGVAVVFYVALEFISWIVSHIAFLGGLLVLLLNLVGMLVGLAYVALIVVTAVKAFAGKEWEIPYLGKIARDQLAGRVPTP
ncbi:MAG TPA: DUF4870 domain-containing protein [Chthoniobacter sp.]|jgi:uncharacterized membrane protein